MSRRATLKLGVTVAANEGNALAFKDRKPGIVELFTHEMRTKSAVLQTFHVSVGHLSMN